MKKLIEALTFDDVLIVPSKSSIKPSEADINVTKKIKKAAQFMDIKVLDHLIITDQSYFSFADQGRIRSFSLTL